MKHVVFYSGGACSYLCAKRVIKANGAENVILLFSDTKSEDETLYTFINESAKKLGCELVVLADGRDVWEMAEQENFIYNSRVANCTKALKIKTARDYIKANYTPENCILYMGIDWTEPHRFSAPKKNWSPYQVQYPMGDAPYISKLEMLEEIDSDGLEIPFLYKLGFSHNNCGGFCFKAGIGHFLQLLKLLPDRFFYHAEREKALSDKIFNDKGVRHTILSRTLNGKQEPILLYDLALLASKEHSYANSLYNRQITKNSRTKMPPLKQEELFEFGGCGCFSVEDNNETHL